MPTPAATPTLAHRYAYPIADALVRSVAAALEGWRVLDWDIDHGVSLTLQSANRHLLLELTDRDESVDCFARTARFNLTARDPFSELAQLDAGARAVLERVVGALHRHEGSLPEVPRQDAGGSRVRIRQVSVERALIREGRGQYYLNPYVGCTIGCSFCIVEQQADLGRALEGLPRLPWGRWVDVKADLVDVLRREVASLPPGIVRISPIVTDPYQPLERRERLTRRCLEVLLEHGFSPCVLTRAARMAEDIPLLRQFERAWVGVSIPTDDDRVRHAFEPGADSLDSRLACLATCRDAGLDTFAVVQPILPMDPTALVRGLAPLIRVVRIDRLHSTERVRSIYERMGWTHALDPDWIDGTERELRRGFAQAGVQVHPLDDLRELFR